MSNKQYYYLCLPKYTFEKTYLRYRFTIDPDYDNSWHSSGRMDKGSATIEGFNMRSVKWEHIYTTSAIGLVRDDWKKYKREGYKEEKW